MDRDEAIRLLTGGRDGLHEWNQRRKQREEIPNLTEIIIGREDQGRRVMLDATNPIAYNRYRIAYGEAARLLGAARFDHSYGRDFAGRVGPSAGQIRSEATRHCPMIPHDLVELAVDDMMAGRKPRW